MLQMYEDDDDDDDDVKISLGLCDKLSRSTY